MSYTEAQRKKAREHLLRSRLYRIAAYGFLAVAAMVFVIFYNMFANGNVMRFLTNPFLIGMMLFPFLPAYAFALMSKNRRKKAADVMKEGAEPGDMSNERTELYSAKKVK